VIGVFTRSSLRVLRVRKGIIAFIFFATLAIQKIISFFSSVLIRAIILASPLHIRPIEILKRDMSRFDTFMG